MGLIHCIGIHKETGTNKVSASQATFPGKEGFPKKKLEYGRFFPIFAYTKPFETMILLKTNANNVLTVIKEKPFKLERELQRLFESNLETVMGLELVKSECSIKNKRIDTLAFDPQSNAFVIIEYKRDRNTSVFDQGVTYLNLMLQYKEVFIVEYNESLNRNLKRNDIDWSQTRVVFVSSDFTENQIEATNFKDLSIELWQVKHYENGTVTVNPIQKSKTAESIKQITGKNSSQAIKTITEVIKTYTEEDLLKGKSEAVLELYARFKAAIFNLTDSIEVKPQKHYAAFKKDGHNITDIEIQASGLKITINVKQGNLDDPKKLTRDITGIGHFGNGDYEIKVSDDANLEYIMSLVKQAL